MAIQTKPIPALYTVYILRSTVRHASLYIGSTPNPPRRLSQHNGTARGGAAKTSRNSLRPWQMVGLISGFPSMVAALKFEWALTNPHLSVHIPSDSRLSRSTQVKANGQPRRPSKSMVSILSNVHLLLRVPSFARWPLKLHFFVPEVYAAWQKWCATAAVPLRPSLKVVTDFGGAQTSEGELDDYSPAKESESSDGSEQTKPWGIHALPLDYEPIKDYVAKAQGIFEFEREGDCVVCHRAIESGEGLHAVCTNGGCDGVGHLSCWSRHFMPSQGLDNILPIQGWCPKCHGEIQWSDMMKELTLRLRGKKEVDKLLKTKKRRAPNKVKAKV
ncbi:hypothetical protein B0T24DRAFT_577100 [Lasiosphaeria ovina]|uniref:GIY-YIG domain-containing protein n=1 Tax=Lasiosphaeria ovina TaxID=92902 RepID=A0AAE0KDK0_9PEZI|nr:hypothetical protein B0T24DRAFT_577100 [Lasiosphaeria ovina]